MSDPSLISKSRTSYSSSPKPASGAGLGILTVIAFLFAASAGIVYGGMYFYQKGLHEKLDGLTRELSNLEEELEPAIIEEIARVDRGLKVAKSLLNAHVYPSQIFRMLQGNTLARVRFNKFTYALDGRHVALDGKTDGFVNLESQLERLRGLPFITEVKFASVSLDKDGQVGFVIDVLFNENLLRLQE